MLNYRLYRLDGAGKIMSAEWVEAPSDDEAVNDSRGRCGSGSFELWEKNRLVERFRQATAFRPQPPGGGEGESSRR